MRATRFLAATSALAVAVAVTATALPHAPEPTIDNSRVVSAASPEWPDPTGAPEGRTSIRADIDAAENVDAEGTPGWRILEPLRAIPRD